MAKDHRRLAEEVAQGILLDDPTFLKEIVERVLQELLEAEMTEHIGAAPYERSATRTGQRNGYKPRALRTRVGTLNLLVPQDREGTFSTRFFARYQRNEKALVLALMEMYVEGVSTRKVKEITEELCGISFSKSLVSSLAGSLDSEFQAWRKRQLQAEAYPYLFVDARYEKVRIDGRVVSQGVLLVLAVRGDGFREILAALPGPLRQEPPRDGGFRQAQGAGGGPARDLRRARQGAGFEHRAFGGREVAREGLFEDRRAHRGEHRGLPGLPFLPREPSPRHPHHQRSRTSQSGDKAQDAGGEDLPQPRGVPQAGDGFGSGAERRVGHGQTLSGDGRT